jgi:tetratricopeptide (TPR) repeat protein
MDDVLKAAVHAHQEQKLDVAEAAYKKLIASGKHKALVFSNYGALLREQDKPKEALAIYDEGLKFYPGNPAILANRANIIRRDHPVEAFYDLLEVVRKEPLQDNAWITAISIAHELKCRALLQELISSALSKLGLDARIVFALLDLVTDDEDVFPKHLTKPEDLIQLAVGSISELSSAQRGEALMTLALIQARRGNLTEAMEAHAAALNELEAALADTRSRPKKLSETYHAGSWNLGCQLLILGQLDIGWKLYEHGLRVPSKTGQQKWQRALRKYFTPQQLPLWQGERLEGKHLLLLEEQGIGDTMMFLSLVPSLVEEADRISVIVSTRLESIYKRSFGHSVNILTHRDVAEGALGTFSSDYQSPIGSICRHRFLSVSNYAPKVPVLSVDQQRVGELRDSYRQQLCKAGLSEPKVILGVSWSGGGAKERIATKSMPLDQFQDILAISPDVGFVSLQYGPVGPRIQYWQAQGINIIHDTSIDPLIDMDQWLHQVAACDAVLSVANTTIHGAGGLDIPTLCLLSRSSDWRWFRDPMVTRSYWYPSVHVARQTRAGDWAPAANEAKEWILKGCPRLDGVADPSEQPS